MAKPVFFRPKSLTAIEGNLKTGLQGIVVRRIHTRHPPRVRVFESVDIEAASPSLRRGGSLRRRRQGPNPRRDRRWLLKAKRIAVRDISPIRRALQASSEGWRVPPHGPPALSCLRRPYRAAIFADRHSRSVLHPHAPIKPAVAVIARLSARRIPNCPLPADVRSSRMCGVHATSDIPAAGKPCHGPAGRSDSCLGLTVRARDSGFQADKPNIGRRCYECLNPAARVCQPLHGADAHMQQSLLINFCPKAPVALNSCFCNVPNKPSDKGQGAGR